MAISISSLTALGAKKSELTDITFRQMSKGEESSEEVQKLREEKLALEEKLLQMKSSSDTSGLSEQTQEEIEEQLEKVTEALKAAESRMESAPKAESSSGTQRRFDEYVQGGESESPGIYSLKADDEGGYDISFQPYSGSSTAEEKAEAVSTMNTDRVDEEIEGLKRERKKMEEQVHQAEVEQKSREEIRELRRQLASVESEIVRKDNDSYRRQHAFYTEQ